MSVRIGAVGDIMLGESFYEYNRGPRAHIERLGAAFLDADVQALLRSHEVMFGNVECVLSNVGYRPRSLRSRHLRGRPECAALLREWGFTLSNVANNHILEHGREAACDTIRHLRGAGLAVVGAGGSAAFELGCESLRLTVRGMRIGALAGCLVPDRYAFDGGGPLEALLRETSALAACCEIVLVSLHWGTEYMDYPAPEQRAIAQAFANAGATLLLGHHPHVIQGIERVGRCLVAYSLGNFLFDQPFADARWSVLLSCRVGPGGVEEWEAFPVQLDGRHSPRRPGPATQARLVRELTRRGRLLEVGPGAGAYRAESRRRRLRTRWQRAWTALRNLPGFPLAYTAQLLVRPVLRRLDRW